MDLDNNLNETDHNETSKIIIVVLMILSAILIFGGNCLVVAAVLTTKRLKSVTNVYVVSLAIADLLVAVLVLPFSITSFYYYNNPPDILKILCNLWISCDILLCTASIYSLCIISFDRYMAVTQPLHYTTRRTKKRAYLVSAIAWLLSFVVITPPLFNENAIKHNLTHCDFTMNQDYRIVSATFSFFLPFVLMVFVYVRIFVVSYRRITNFRNGSLSSARSSSGQMDSKETQENFKNRHSIKNCLNSIHWMLCACCRSFEKNKTVVLDSSGSKNDSSISYNHWSHEQISNRAENVELLSFNKCYMESYTIEPKPLDSPQASNNIDDDSELIREDHLSSSAEIEENEISIRKKCLEERKLNTSVTKETKSTEISPLFINERLRDMKTFKVNSVSTENSASSKVDMPLSVLDLDKESQNEVYIKNADSPRKSLKVRIRDDYQYSNAEKRRICFQSTILNIPKKQDHLNSYRYSLPLSFLGGNFTERAAFVRENKTAKTLAVVVGCFSICWLPFFIAYVIEPYLKRRWNYKYPDYLKTGYTWLGYVNSVFNPFIYAFYNKEYATAFRRLLRLNVNR